MTETRGISVVVNGQPRRATVEVRTTLVDFLREELRLTGTHVGCEHGVCGACTVLVDGEAVRGCLLLAVQADGAHVETVESLAPDPEHLNPLQIEFVRHHGVQCGFCTGGILMSLTAALRDNARPTRSKNRDTRPQDPGCSGSATRAWSMPHPGAGPAKGPSASSAPLQLAR